MMLSCFQRILIYITLTMFSKLLHMAFTHIMGSFEQHNCALD